MTKNEILNSKNYLKEVIKDGETIYSTILSVASNGMSRKIQFFIIHENRIKNISHHIATLKSGGARHSRNDWGCVTVSGCGMDMAYYIIHSLSRELDLKLNKESL